MRKLDKLQRERALSKFTETASIRQWFVDFDDDNWDAQLTVDIAAGRLYATADAAHKEHTAGKAKPL